MQGAHVFTPPPPFLATGHAFLAPSSASRWKVCPLSAALEAAFPESEDRVAAAEGHCCHWAVQCFILGHAVAVGMADPAGTLVTREMIETIAVVEETMQRMLGPAWRSMLVVERKMHIARIHPTHCSGTPDYWCWVQKPDGTFALYIFDLKFGHRVVEAVDNDQLVTYYAGIVADVLERAGQDYDQTIEVVLTIIQPRAPHRQGPVRSWRVKGSDLRAHINILRGAAEEAVGPNPRARADVDACRDCKGRHTCAANQRAGYVGIAKAYESIPYELSAHALGLETRILEDAAKLLASRVAGLKAEIEARQRAGQDVPYWSMQSTAGALAWTCPPDQAIALGAMIGKNLARPLEPVTPTQAINAGVPREMVEAFAKRPPGAMKLTPDDGTKARLTFMSSST